MSEPQSFDVTQVIDESRISGAQWTVLGISLLTALFDGYDTQGIAYVAPVMAHDLGFPPADLGPIFSAGLLGLTLGAIFFGMLADKLGRKQMIIWPMVIFGVFFPMLYCSRQKKIRYISIVQDLPFFIDLMALSTEAGLDFMGALDVVAARQAQQPFACTVVGYLLGHHFGPRRGEKLFELRPRLLGDAGHLVEGLGATEIDPVPKLLRPHLALRRRHPDRAQTLGEFGTRQADQRWLCRRHVGFKRDFFHRRSGSGGGRIHVGEGVDHETPNRPSSLRWKGLQIAFPQPHANSI